MNQLQRATTGKTFKAEDKNQKIFASVFYHDIFDYPLNEGELIKWQAGRKVKIRQNLRGVSSKDGYYFLAGKDSHILSRILRKRISNRKLRIARKAGQIFSYIPSIRMVGVTGALAMENANQDSDVDLIIICKKGALWTTRLLALTVFKLTGFPVRKFGDKNQKDKLCLNMWLDESALIWPKRDRNIYTAHEISQIKPILDREGTYGQFLYKNSWIRDYWPNATTIRQFTQRISAGQTPLRLLETPARVLQLWYMKSKITREIVGKNKAIFHPFDWWGILKTKIDGILYS